METDNTDNQTEQPQFVNPEYTLFIARLVKTNQQQHGLRHNDPERYHKYCTNRLRRLYVQTKHLHGKRQFRKVELKPEGVKSEVYLHIPLLQAERAWAVVQCRRLALEAMVEKQGTGKRVTRSHMMSKFGKAVKHAFELRDLALVVCDGRTQIEATGYASNLKGQQELEKGNFAAAFEHLSRGQMMFSALAQLGEPYQPSGQSSMCRLIATEIGDQVRVCQYQMERTGLTAKFEPTEEDAELVKKIEGLKSSIPSVSDGNVSQAAVSFSWLDEQYPVPNQDIQPVIVQLMDSQNKLYNAMDSEITNKNELNKEYNKGLQAALKSVTDTLQSADRDTDAETCEKLEALKWAIKGTQLQHTLQWGQERAEDMRARFDEQMLKQLAGGRSGGKGGKGAAASKPEDLIRVYDEIMNAAKELEQLAMENLSGMIAEKILSQSAFEAAYFRACRCYYVGHAYLRKKRHSEAYALFKRVSNLVDQSVEKMEDMVQPPSEAITLDMEKLKQKALAFQIVVKVEVDIAKQKETKSVHQGLQKVNINQEADNGTQKQQKQQETIRYLVDNLDKWESFVGQNAKNARVFKIPPNPEMIPMRPILLNTAEQYIQMPSLKHRYTQKQESMLSGVSRFLGFGKK
eukprot:TRINITY_DN3550_c0_g1_i1.p1 TRINITY_DN3550_c0_g1~~TRINITY_DN3550_c0_g1_i1.p1  ORF type:complete len:638 (+),score=76.85 TRINITY_DN3550_c0_g1_i1:26-1915(+)